MPHSDGTKHSISGQNFHKQFKEEFDAAKYDAGTFAPQTFLHLGVRWGIVTDLFNHD